MLVSPIFSSSLALVLLSTLTSLVAAAKPSETPDNYYKNGMVPTLKEPFVFEYKNGTRYKLKIGKGVCPLDPLLNRRKTSIYFLKMVPEPYGSGVKDRVSWCYHIRTGKIRQGDRHGKSLEVLDPHAISYGPKDAYYGSLMSLIQTMKIFSSQHPESSDVFEPVETYLLGAFLTFLKTSGNRSNEDLSSMLKSWFHITVDPNELDTIYKLT